MLDSTGLVGGRYVHLDVSRVCCVACVVLNVFDPRYALWNTLYVQNWVLQVLWLVSGICLGLSKRSLTDYISRLSLYLSIGVVVNWAVFVINGWSWFEHAWSVVGQMIFVFWLILIVLILAPLQVRLESLRQGPGDALPDVAPEEHSDDAAADTTRVLNGLLAIAAGMLALFAGCAGLLAPQLQRLATTLWSQPEDAAPPQPGQFSDPEAFAKHVGWYIQATACSMWIIFIFPKFFRTNSWLAWALLGNFYLHRTVVGLGAGDLPFHGLHLTMVALTAQRLGLRHRRTLGHLLHRYWMVPLFICCFLWQPGLKGDVTGLPLGEVFMRQRVVFVELLLVVTWLTAGPQMVDPKIFTEDKLAWVNEWALLVFLVHRGVAWLFPWPLAYIFLLALGPISVVFRGER